MEFQEFAFWLMTAMMMLIATVLGWFLSNILNEMKGIRGSIAELNNHVAVVIEKQSWHEKEIEKLNKRIDDIKPKRGVKNA